METRTGHESVETQRPTVIFREASTQHLPSKMPTCFLLIRGFVLGLIVFLCIFLIAVWMNFTIEFFDVDENKKEVFFESDKHPNSCNSSSYSCSLARDKVAFWLNNIFVFLGTILTAISILAFVFVSATCVFIHKSNRLDLI